MKVIFTCGGTAGHVNPALALAGYMREKDAGTQILFVGAERGLERDLIAHHMFPFVPAPPRHREGWVVTLADKYCTLREVFMRRPYAPLEETVM